MGENIPPYLWALGPHLLPDGEILGIEDEQAAVGVGEDIGVLLLCRGLAPVERDHTQARGDALRPAIPSAHVAPPVCLLHSTPQSAPQALLASLHA